ncbi:hypothetical protein HW115_10140 [Verrucomicrobiaceae bacterium N1E253]|uniref:Uncharacterized protein n=1 Tax=Oceaniferula marina TaxID=2748318 RepID=A0A851GEK3_9BACT|nr:hypothetical protein [Oceaniferula marina]NWK55973.1 hypothetical protein [Oceaniferula marina]
MIHSLQIEGYRSLLDISLKLAPLTVVQGATRLKEDLGSRKVWRFD